MGNLFNALSQMMRLTKMSSIYGRALRRAPGKVSVFLLCFSSSCVLVRKRRGGGRSCFFLFFLFFFFGGGRHALGRKGVF